MNADILEEERIDLRNGCSLSIRPLRRGEEGTVREFCARLSPRAAISDSSSVCPWCRTPSCACWPT